MRNPIKRSKNYLTKSPTKKDLHDNAKLGIIKTFSLKITELTQKFLIAGKLKEGVPYGSGFTFDSGTLRFKPTRSDYAFSEITALFERMLEAKE